MVPAGPGNDRIAGSTGHRKWYIFGPNFKYADCNPRFLSMTMGHTITHSRNFTYDLSPATTSSSTTTPDQTTGSTFCPRTTSTSGATRELFKCGRWKASVNLGNLDGRSAANAMRRCADSVTVDDIYMMDTFTVEDPDPDQVARRTGRRG